MARLPINIDVRPNSIAIIGWEDGGAGMIHSWIETTGWHVACFVHPAATPPVVDVVTERKKREAKQFDFPMNGTFKGLALLTALDWPKVLLNMGIRHALVMLSDSEKRYDAIAEGKNGGLTLINAIHPTATIMKEAVLHDNVILQARALVGYRAELHPGVVLNTGAQVDHHNVLYPCAHVNPGAILAGNVVVERSALIHSGAIIINRIRIGTQAIVGAGAVVIRNVPPRVTVVGNPARIVKKSVSCQGDNHI